MIRLLVFATLAAFAQDPIPTVAPPVATPPPITVVTVSVPPLAPPDLNSPYASPRDGARHRFQATLAELTANRNIKDGIRGFEQAFLEDRTYGAAAFNLGILCAIAEKWDDAASALDAASRLDPELGSAAAPQLERLRRIATLEKSAEGRRTRAYDEALLTLLAKPGGMTAGEEDLALANLGRIDAKRWEAPALLAALHGDGSGYETASKFLEIAVANATEPAVKKTLEAAHAAAERELTYASMRSAAEAASDQGDYAKAAELYQSAWKAIPARVGNGLDATSALLLTDDTEHACALLARLRDSKDPAVEAPAGAMLKALAPIEPAAAAPASDAAEFFGAPGPREPVRIASMIPPIARKPLELYTRPLPKLVDDPERVLLLASLDAEASSAVVVPALPPPTLPGENPWREIEAIESRTEAVQAQAPQSVDLSNNAADARAVQVSSEPAGARIFIASGADAACETPCMLRMTDGEYSLRLALNGYRDALQTIEVKSDIQDVKVAMEVLHGSVIVETSTPASVKVNGMSAGVESSPIELSMVPGLYRIGAEMKSGYREWLLTVKPGARLRLDLALPER